MTVIAALVSLAACGEETSAKPADGPLTKDQIAAAALTQGDVKGYTISDGPTVAKDSSAHVTNEACRPIVGVLVPGTIAYDGRLVRRGIVKAAHDSSARASQSYQLALFSVESSQAAGAAIEKLKNAVTSCANGFQAEVSGEDRAVRRVLPNKTELGTGSVDFSLEYRTGRKVRFVVTSSGASLISVAASDQFAHQFVPVPKELVAAQREKVEKAS
ncbi:hypothetical protein AB0907_22525 [Streptomyces sp. NPDC006975]|uniref:hypothetical protein n=1 Tax=Streptomyces sp. NPDC006975 TaxID=3154310 RepID=UPI00345158F3